MMMLLYFKTQNKKNWELHQIVDQRTKVRKDENENLDELEPFFETDSFLNEDGAGARGPGPKVGLALL